MIINVPYPTFLDLDGEPLDAGYIYIGLPDVNPETNPLTVYWDSALTQPAAQPIRTVEGAFSYIGIAANIFTTQNYSITIRDKNLNLVSTFPDSNVFDPLSNLAANLANSTDLTQGVSLVGGAERIVNNIAALRMMPRNGAKFAYVLGYYTPGDGGGGCYFQGTGSENGGSIIVGNDGTIWNLAETKEYSVKQFGAKGDGTTDDRTAIQAAINTGMPVYVPYSPSAYSLSARLTLNGSKKLRGDFAQTSIIMATDNDYFAELAGGNNTIDGFIVNCAFGNGSSIFLLRNDLSIVSASYITNIQISQGGAIVSDMTGATNPIVDMHFINFLTFSHRGTGFNVMNSSRVSYWVMEDIIVSYNASTNANFPAFSLKNLVGCSLTNCFTELINITPSTVPSNDAFLLSNCVTTTLNGCLVSVGGGYGFRVTNGSHEISFVNCESLSTIKNGFLIDAVGAKCEDIQFSNCSAFFSQGTGPAYDGFLIQGANRVQLTGCAAKGNTGAGIFVNNSTLVTISGGRSDANTGLGVDSSGTNSLLMSGMGLNNNTGGNANLSSSNMYVATCQGTAGSLISITGPGSA